MNKTTRFGVSLPTELIEAFDRSIEKRGYTARSEAIRDLMRDYLVDEEWQLPGHEVVATVTIVYDHHTRELSHTLNNLQHDYHNAVMCTTHVHLDEHHCLEVIILKGAGEKVRAIADKLISTKGVKHGKIACTSTGGDLR